MTELRSIETLCNDVEKFIVGAMDSVEKGQLMSFFELEDKVRVLCEALATSPAEEGKKYLGHLDAMHRQLDLLKQVMEDQQEKIRIQLMSLDAKRKANQAYAKSDTMTPKQEE